jgi:hypothetical protein
MKITLFKDNDMEIFTESDHAFPNCGAPLLGVEHHGQTNFYRDDDIVMNGKTAAQIKAELETGCTLEAAEAEAAELYNALTLSRRSDPDDKNS